MATSEQRKPISVATAMDQDRDGNPVIVTTVVCSDGTIWRDWGGTGWYRVDPPPSDFTHDGA